MGFGANVIKLFRRNLRIFVISWSVCLWQAFPTWCNAWWQSKNLPYWRNFEVLYSRV